MPQTLDFRLPTPVDPRIGKRRAEVRRQEGRRRLKLLVVLLVITALAAGMWGASLSGLLDVDRVEIHGAVHTPRQEILARAGLEMGGPMVDVDEGQAASGLEELPWVGEAHVQRRWPGTVRIDLVERRAAAALKTVGDTWALVDDTGRVLAHQAAMPPEVVAIDGLPAAGPPGSVLAPAAGPSIRVAGAIPPSLRDRVTSAVPSADGGVELRLRPVGVVRIGRAEHLPEKMRAIETVLARVPTSDLAVLDVSTPASPVLTREGGDE